MDALEDHGEMSIPEMGVVSNIHVWHSLWLQSEHQEQIKL